MHTISQLIEIFSQFRPSSTLLSIREYNNNNNELSNFLIAFHIDYKNALQRSLKIAEELPTTSEILSRAKDEVINSLETSLINFKNPIEEKDDGYQRFFDIDNSHIKGIKLHIDTKTLHIYGFFVSKEILRAGTYREVNSSELTKAKNFIRNQLPVSKFRQFALRENNFSSIRVEKININNFSQLETM